MEPRRVSVELLRVTALVPENNHKLYWKSLPGRRLCLWKKICCQQSPTAVSVVWESLSRWRMYQCVLWWGIFVSVYRWTVKIQEFIVVSCAATGEHRFKLDRNVYISELTKQVTPDRSTQTAEPTRYIHLLRLKWHLWDSRCYSGKVSVSRDKQWWQFVAGLLWKIHLGFRGWTPEPCKIYRNIVKYVNRAEYCFCNNLHWFVVAHETWLISVRSNYSMFLFLRLQLLMMMFIFVWLQSQWIWASCDILDLFVD